MERRNKKLVFLKRMIRMSAEEKDELRPGLPLDTCMQPLDIGQEVLSYSAGIFSIAPA